MTLVSVSYGEFRVKEVFLLTSRELCFFSSFISLFQESPVIRPIVFIGLDRVYRKDRIRSLSWNSQKRVYV